jgi:CheY-like chemotaxis protein
MRELDYFYVLNLFKKVKILLVDDNQSITKMLSQYLSAKGHECTVSNDGRNGLTLIEQQKFDAVLLDLAMPDFTGADVINALAKSGKIKEQKIILFTASSLGGKETDELLEKGVYACIRKPAKLDVILKTIGA